MLRSVLSRRSPARRFASADRPAVGPLVGPAARVRAGSPGAELLEDRRLLSATGAGDHDGDCHAHHDEHGAVLHGFPPNPAGILGPGAGTGDYDGSGDDLPLGQTFALHSNPGADHVIYLDFDGHDLQDPGWNGGRRTQISAFSRDADRDNFDDQELQIIQETWLRISEQFLPFNVDVTTEEPPLDRLMNSGGTDTQWGVRALFGTPVGEIDGAAGTGGLAYVGSFNSPRDNPTFIFDTAGNNANGFAVAGAHEIGHTLGLSHDGTGTLDYYSGHGSGETAWGAVMGVSYSSNVIQFSRGEYEDANQQQDDLEIITTQNGFDYREDDFGGTPTSAGRLVGGRTVGPLTEVRQSGIVERNTDFDVFAFTTATGGDFTIDVEGPSRGQTLDIVAELYNADGELIFRSAPDGDLDAAFDLDLEAGEYLLVVTGGGNVSDSDEGYSDYGSIGSYTISGVIEGFVPEDEDDDGDGDGGGDDGGDDGGGDDGGGDDGGGDEPRDPRPRSRGKVRVYGKRLNTNENGKSARFRVKLSKQPTDTVVIRLRMSDLTEGALVTEKLVFTPENWNRLQTVVVFGMDDADNDGAERFKVLTARAESSDEAYDDLNVKDMRGVNRDNDTANRTRDMKERFRDQFREARREARRDQRKQERQADRIARRQAREDRQAARRAAADGPEGAALPPRDLADVGGNDGLFGGSGGDLFGGV